MTRATRAAVLALIATVGAWPALDEKLQSYPSIHARETAKIKVGDAKGAKYILFDAFHGLGNREQAFSSQQLRGVTYWSRALPRSQVADAQNAARGATCSWRES